MFDNGFHKENNKFFSHFGISEESGIPSKTIALVLQDKFKDNQNAQQIFNLCCNLLSRLFVNIDLFIPSGTISTIESNILLSDYAMNNIRLIYPKGNFKCYSDTSDLSIYDGVLIVGNNTNGTAISIISNGWNIYINKKNIVSDNINPISACAAACFGVAELFKYVLKLQGSSPCGEMSFSLLNYSPDIPESNPTLPTELDLGEITLVGVGAIGSGAIYLLKCLNKVKGRLDLVDNDRYSFSNLNRYIITDESVIGLNKVDVAEHILKKHAKLQIQKYPEVYDDFINRKKYRIDTLISSVDKKIVRFKMQGDLPRLIIDAATTESAIDLARIDFGSGGACLGCLYLPESKDNYLYQLISEKTGLNIERVKFLYERSEGVSSEDIDIISSHFKKDLSSWIGSPIESLYAHEYCGSGKISSNVNSNEVVIAPISFISALAGIFIISEVIKDRYFPDFKVNNHFYIDTLKLPNPRFHNFKSSNAKCPYCNDDVIIETYREKWMDL